MEHRRQHLYQTNCDNIHLLWREDNRKGNQDRASLLCSSSSSSAFTLFCCSSPLSLSLSLMSLHQTSWKIHSSAFNSQPKSSLSLTHTHKCTTPALIHLRLSTKTWHRENDRHQERGWGGRENLERSTQSFGAGLCERMYVCAAYLVFHLVKYVVNAWVSMWCVTDDRQYQFPSSSTFINARTHSGFTDAASGKTT